MRHLFMIGLLLLGLGTAALADELDQFSIPLQKKEHEYGRWIMLGAPVKEYPVCYQVWKCDKSHLDNQTIQRDKLPVGKWGVCENYLDPNPQNPNFCSRCDVAPPSQPCY